METPKKQTSPIETYIKTVLEESKKTRREYSLYGRVYVYIQDFVSRGVDIAEVLEAIENKIPPHLTTEIDTIFVGSYQAITDKGATAMYDSGAIYVSNEQDSVEDMVDDIVHEIAHSLEQPYGFPLYSDGVLEKEFLAKRLKSFELLSAWEFVSEKSRKAFMNVEYDQDFDELLHKKNWI